MIAIIDYDAGNIRSVEKALLYLGQEVKLTRDPKEILGADRAILPGVGSFGDAMEKIRGYGLEEVIREFAASGKPFLGICLGLQLLFPESEESPGVKGLSILQGKIRRIPEKGPDGVERKVPQIGWNSVHFMNDGAIFKDIPSGSYVYFVHSYYISAADVSQVTAVSDYSCIFHAAVEKGKVSAVQFHPEKSGETGLRILRNFVRQK